MDATSLIVIPARLESTRLKHKIMQDIHGVPMLAHVIHRAKQAHIADVLVACDHPRIADLCKTLHVPAVMTDPSLPSGSDRIAQALTLFDKKKTYQWIINVQGDIPSLTTQALEKLHAMGTERSSQGKNHATKNPTKNPMSPISPMAMATLVAPIHDMEERDNPHVVKAIVSWTHEPSASTASTEYGRALYFTRRPVASSDGVFYHHIGLYAYGRDTLEAFQRLPPSPLERFERLEQLRAIEANIPIYVSLLKDALRGIDTQEDLDAIRHHDTMQESIPCP